MVVDGIAAEQIQEIMEMKSMGSKNGIASARLFLKPPARVPRP